MSKQVELAKAAADKAYATCREQSSIAGEAKEQVASLRRSRDEAAAKVTAAERSAAEARRRSEELEARLSETMSELARVKTELETELAEHRAVQSELSKKFEAAEKAQLAYKKKAAQGDRVEEQVAALRKARTQLADRLKLERKEASQSKRRIRELQERVSRSAVQFPKKGKGTGGGGVHHGEPAIDVRVRDSISALAKATADLEKERRKLEATALQSRYGSLDAARLGRAFVNSFRSQLRLPADNLIHSIRRLLDLPLETPQRKLVESALESALTVQASIQEDASLQDDPRGSGSSDRAAA